MAQKPSPASRKQAPPPDQDTTDATGLATVMTRNAFYRDGYRTMLKVALAQGGVIVALILLLFFVIQGSKPENRYFATTEDGRLVPMVPLNEPNLSTPALMSWVAQSATEVMTFGFHDYRRRLQESSRHFTRTGWASFTKALEDQGVITRIEANRQVVSAAPLAAPVIVSEGMVGPRYQWVVEMPMSITYQAGSKIGTTNILAKMVVVRVPQLESPNGIGIEQWIAVPR
ncbi:MAG: type IV secretion protein IcmL [Alphaproteobacteria bacterium]|nr:type IV secretion protein IcmL [Alphaproteobacteria bacterium]